MKSVEEVWKIIDRHSPPRPGVSIPLEEANGRVIAGAVTAAVDSPLFDQSAVDGYALTAASGVFSVMSGVNVAGSAPREEELAEGMALRVLTGGPVPRGSFCVAKQEECLHDGGSVSLCPGVELGREENIRPRASNFAKGGVILEGCGPLNAGAVSLLSAAGLVEVTVAPVLKVQHIVTGSELRTSRGPAGDYQIFDSNGPLMSALLKKVGIDFQQVAIPDDVAILSRLVREFSGDVLLISGGVGTGDHDHTRPVLRGEGFELLVEGVLSRPGKPLVFGVRENQVAFGIPGNPLSHWVSFHVFLDRAMKNLQGSKIPVPWKMKTPGALKRSSGAETVWTPGEFRHLGEELGIVPLPWNNSSDLRPLAMAEALIRCDPGELPTHVQVFPIL